jgi:hypothetical protein
MWFSLMPAADWKASIVRWLVEPLPSEAYGISPGLALAAATSSFTDLYGAPDETTSACGVTTMLPISSKSLIGS